MANIKSQIKRVKTNEKARIRNVGLRSEVKTLSKRIKGFVEDNKKQDAFDVLQLAYKKIDKLAAKHIFHKNNAANKKSKLTKLVNSLDGEIKVKPKTVKSKPKKKSVNKKTVSKKTQSKKASTKTSKKPVSATKKSAKSSKIAPKK
jgi:small subunit ribosomal protein S20